MNWELSDDSIRNTVVLDSVQNVIDQSFETLWEEEFNEISFLGFKITEFMWKALATAGFVLLFMNFARILQYRDELVDKLKVLKVKDWEIGSELHEFYTSYNEFEHWCIPSFGSLTFTLFLLLVSFTSFVIGGESPEHMTIFEGSLIETVNLILTIILLMSVVKIIYRQNLLGSKSLSEKIKGQVYYNKNVKIRKIDYLRWLIVPLIVILASYIDVLNHIRKITDLLFLVLAIISCMVLPFSFWVHRQKRNYFTRSLVNSGLGLNLLFLWFATMSGHSGYNVEDSVGAVSVIFVGLLSFNWGRFLLQQRK